MLKKLQSRVTAAIIAICVVALSVPLGAAISLGRLRGEAEDLFYTSSGENGRAIESTLFEIAVDGESLAMTAERYLGAADERILAVRRGTEAVWAKGGPKALHSAAAELQTAIYALDAHLRTITLSEADLALCEQLIFNIQSCYAQTQKSSYNQEAEVFNGKLEEFPASLWSSITGVGPLELYA